MKQLCIAWGLALLLSSCVTPPRPPLTREQGSDLFPVYCWSQDFQPYIGNWQAQVKKKYPDGAVLLLVHGDDLVNDWTLCPDEGQLIDAIEAVKVMHLIANGKPVVVVSCNPKKVLIFTHDVCYSRDLVWTCPFFFDVNIDMRTNKLASYISNINEFDVSK